MHSLCYLYICICSYLRLQIMSHLDSVDDNVIKMSFAMANKWYTFNYRRVNSVMEFKLRLNWNSIISRKYLIKFIRFSPDECIMKYSIRSYQCRRKMTADGEANKNVFIYIHIKFNQLTDLTQWPTVKWSIRHGGPAQQCRLKRKINREKATISTFNFDVWFRSNLQSQTDPNGAFHHRHRWTTNNSHNM